ncbi:MAG: D-alanyl-D-alanine carboxypeptidase/D-alanyl-D-alanine-endopeptidase [Tannerellaceae bacterium]|nr:D-alanyl-D-alanine carboxypeptidase/D-alanyl-D-alanine-endopeptidase [Tannerellaceae bacterium]
MEINRKILISILAFSVCGVYAQIPQPIKQFMRSDKMQGASFSFQARDIQNGEIVYAYDPDRVLTPASVMKLFTTATALELLGEETCFPTTLQYDGELNDGVLHGNLYIKGSGDPTLGSAHFSPDRAMYTYDQNDFMPEWVFAIRAAGIRKITGSVIADESIFDTEGISPKWLMEDLGSYYGAGSYGLSVFDNILRIYLATGPPGRSPVLTGTEPAIASLRFHNYLVSSRTTGDSSLVVGFPYADDRFLYGTVPPNREKYLLRGDIPDPPLFLAQYLYESLTEDGVEIQGKATNYRLLSLAGQWNPTKRTEIVTTYSPPLTEILQIINERSHNLFADALIKILGLSYKPKQGEVLSSFGKGSRVVENYWKSKGLDMHALHMVDGSGLSVTNKLSAGITCALLWYMAKKSPYHDSFRETLPRAGMEGSVRNFLKGSSLQGHARLKSGSMSAVKGYAGYITKGEKTYAVSLFVNNYNCDGREITMELEKLLLALF